MEHTVDIQPPKAAAAGCSATCEFSRSDSNLPYWDYVYYMLTATPADGWIFGYFEWYLHYETASGESDGSPHRGKLNPETSSYLYDGFIDLDALQTGKGRDVTTIRGLKAVFVHDPTNLLVNSFNRSSSVQLVYYPATNLLVADY